MFERHPLISIVTPSFNQGGFIEETILSVLHQDYPSVEHIIADGGSTDQTINILKKYSHLIWFSERDAGQSDAINKGFRLAKGEILYWLCSDDIILPNALTEVAKAINPSLERYVVVGRSIWIDETGRILNPHPFFGSRDHQQIVRFWKYHPLPQPSVFFHRKVFEEFGPLAIQEGLAMDYDLWLRASQKYFFYFVDSVLSHYRLHDSSKCMIRHFDAHKDLSRLSRLHWGPRMSTSWWNYWLSYHFSADLNRPELQQAQSYLEASVQWFKTSHWAKSLWMFLMAGTSSPWILIRMDFYRRMKRFYVKKVRQCRLKGFSLYERVLLKRLDLTGQLNNARIETEAPHFVSAGSFRWRTTDENVLFTHPFSAVSFTVKEKQWRRLEFGIFLHPTEWTRPGHGVIYEVLWNETPIFRKLLNPKQVQTDRDIFLFSLVLPEGNGKEDILTFRATPEKEGDNQFCYGGWLRPRLTAG